MTVHHALVVEDDEDSARMVAALVARAGYTAATAASLASAKQALEAQAPDLVLLDLQLPDGNGLSLFGHPALSRSRVVLMTGHASLDTSIDALRLGAADYLVKPVAGRRLQDILAQRHAGVAEAPGAAAARRAPTPMVGNSPALRRVAEQIARVAPATLPVLVHGESGTGKELVALSIHESSRRADGPFLAVNCGALSPQLVESELFGHERGSFTGADRQHIGFFERAHGGTLFLDEVTEMPPALQTRLLRVLETGHFMRVGGTQPRHCDVRVVAATNRDPALAVAQGVLREDLYWRLAAFPLYLPPLRERPGDALLLAEHFLGDIARRTGVRKQLPATAGEQFARHAWPGNVRELRNAMERALLMSEGDVIDLAWLPVPGAPGGTPPAGPGEWGHGPDLTEAQAGVLRFPVGSCLAEVERSLILATFEHYAGQREKTAAALGVSARTLYNRLRDYGR